MKSLYVKFAVLLVLVGLLAACTTPATEVPASQPTEESAPATEAVMEAPAATETAAESSPTAEAVAGASVRFSNDILPILESRCVNCHGGDRTEEGLSLKSYSDLMAGSEGGAVIAPGDAENSLLAELVASQKMPKRGPKLTPPQVQLIIDWINQGALDN